MTEQDRIGRKFAFEYLSPLERLTEIMFALIMVLAIISTNSITWVEEDEKNEKVIIAALGCNAAWGIIDGVVYVLTSVFNKGRCSRIIHSAKSSPNRKEAMDAVGEELGNTLIGCLDTAERQRIHDEVLKAVSQTTPAKIHVSKADIMGAVSCFLIVFAATFPVVAPFFVLENFETARLISNAIALVILFVVGVEWARHANFNRLKAGVGFAVLGLIMVGVTVVLGG